MNLGSSSAWSSCAIKSLQGLWIKLYPVTKHFVGVISVKVEVDLLEWSGLLWLLVLVQVVLVVFFLGFDLVYKALACMVVVVHGLLDLVLPVTSLSLLAHLVKDTALGRCQQQRRVGCI
jgi:hypothetical protein